MKNPDLLSISGGLLVVLSILTTAVLSEVSGINPEALATIFVGGIFAGFLICLSGVAVAEYNKVKSEARAAR